MFRIINSLNRSGKQSSGGDGTASIPFDPEYAMPTSGFVTFVASRGYVVSPEDVLRYGFPESSRPIFAVFYTPRNIQGHSLNCIDMIMYADSVEKYKSDALEGLAVLGHTRAMPGSYAPLDPQCVAFVARYESTQSMISRNAVFVPSYVLLKNGEPAGNMWTAAVDMAQASEWGVCSVTWSDGDLNNIPLKFARSPIGKMEVYPLWFPYAGLEISKSRYPVAVGSNGTSLYWACWRPVAVPDVADLYSMQMEWFSQDTAESVGSAVDNVAQITLVQPVSN